MRAIAFAILAHAFLGVISRYDSVGKEAKTSAEAIALMLLLAALGCAIAGI